VWDHDLAAFVDPTTGAVLPTWEQALDAIDADPTAEPMHVLRFGKQIDYQGILASDEDKVGKAVGYLTKYVTKDVSSTHGDPDEMTPAQLAHLQRLHAHVEVLPCSPRCANWLRYGVQPKHAGPDLVPGHCDAKAHDREHLGLGGRRVLVSRDWSGETLAQHAADRADVVRAVLEEAGIDAPTATAAVRQPPEPTAPPGSMDAHRARRPGRHDLRRGDLHLHRRAPPLAPAVHAGQIGNRPAARPFGN
jgi:hypothetical protein